jgi:hypothetical protein
MEEDSNSKARTEGLVCPLGQRIAINWRTQTRLVEIVRDYQLNIVTVVGTRAQQTVFLGNAIRSSLVLGSSKLFNPAPSNKSTVPSRVNDNGDFNNTQKTFVDRQGAKNLARSSATDLSANGSPSMIV